VASIESTFHQALIESYEDSCGGDWASGPNDGYFFQFLLRHLSRVPGREQESAGLLEDYDWVWAKLRNAGARSLAADLAAANRHRTPLDSLIQTQRNAVSRQQIADALGAHARRLFWESGPSTWVMVAGTGLAAGLPEPVHFASESVGRELARAGHGLVSGGWPGVDHITCREYVNQLWRDEVPSKGRLRHVVPEGKRPDFWNDPRYAGEGDLDPSDNIGHAVDSAQALIMIGGDGATSDIFRAFVSRRRPVFPLGGTGGDSQRALTSQPLDLQSVLGRSIANRIDARAVAKAIIERLPPAAPMPS
jgi:hypothetical protein